MSGPHDALCRFLIEGSGIRGVVVHLDTTWRTVLERRRYPEPVRSVLGESLGAVTLLASTIKFDGTLTLQAQGGGPLELLVAEATGRRTLRALARFVEPRLRDTEDLAGVLGDARLAITVDPGEGRDRYQGIVEVGAPNVAGLMDDYFARSEQLPTRMWLAAGETRVAGLLLQQLPERDELLHDPDERAEIWREQVMLAETVTDAELLDLDAHHLLRRLFGLGTVRVFEPEAWGFACTCSHERVATMLQTLGRDEVEDILAEEGAVKVTCDFCGLAREFDAIDVGHLFTETPHESPAWRM